ncbi:MAG: SRPBCC domain-containing protein [Proteobacteria bacterium]|nr:SRPBCC domain-containing protein [Pseudomonadota bacterium]
METSIPPVIKSITVARPIETTFKLFTEDVGQWWPLASHSAVDDNAATCRLEGGVGGRFYETSATGDEYEWGVVQSWNPPSGLSFTWYPGREPDTAQLVEIAFAPADGGTQVTLTHSGWESLGADALETREGYVSGWELVFIDKFGGYCRQQ